MSFAYRFVFDFNMAFNEMMIALILSAAIGCGLVAGVFFAFSTFIMKALGRISTEAGIPAMQAINVTVLGPWFMGAFFGTGAICIVLLIRSMTIWGEDGATYLFAGSLQYLIGTFLVTILFNVPKNKRLGVLSPSAPDADHQWRTYISAWTAWNHVRTIASTVAALSFCLALGAGV